MIVGQYLSKSPGGDWTVQLKLIEHSTLFSSRKTVATIVDHTTDKNSIWALTHRIPLDDAHGQTVSCPNAGLLNVTYKRNDDETLVVSVGWGGTDKSCVTLGNANTVNGSGHRSLSATPSG